MSLYGITFRVLEVGDEPFLREALYIALWDPPDEPRRPRSVLDHPKIAPLVAGWGRMGDVGYLAQLKESANPIGAVWIRSYDVPPIGAELLDEKTPHLGIAVVEEYQGRGVGSALLGRGLEAAREQYHRVALSVHPKNPARRLYERFGFQLLGASRGGYLVMQREFA